MILQRLLYAKHSFIRGCVQVEIRVTYHMNLPQKELLLACISQRDIVRMSHVDTLMCGSRHLHLSVEPSASMAIARRVQTAQNAT